MQIRMSRTNDGTMSVFVVSTETGEAVGGFTEIANALREYLTVCEAQINMADARFEAQRQGEANAGQNSNSSGAV